jgi:hypothetical protein
VSRRQAWLRSQMHLMPLRLICMKKEPAHEVKRVDEGIELGEGHQEMLQAPGVYVRRLMKRPIPLIPMVPTWRILRWLRYRFHLPWIQSLE